MTVLTANNATSRLASSITTTSTSISVQAGDGAKYPALSGGDTFPVTLIKSDGQLEICRCTARSGDVLTVLRGQEGTTAKAFAAGDRIELRLTKAALDERLAEASEAARAYHGQCRFEYVSGTQCVLKPLNGNGLLINGRQERVPAAGVILSNSGIPTNALRYVYAYMVGTTMTLEAAAAAPVLDTSGIMIKTGDASRSLVGMVILPPSTSQFNNTPTERYVASWFNRKPTTMLKFTSGAATGSDNYVLIDNGLAALVWAQDVVQISIMGQTSSPARNGSYIRFQIDGVPASGGYGYTLPAPNQQMAMAVQQFSPAPSDGLHTYRVEGGGAGTGGVVSWSYDFFGLVPQ